MFNNSISVFYVISLLTIVTTYSSNRANAQSKECIAINKKGFDYLMDYPMNGENGLDSAIALFRQAIECDSTYSIPYYDLTVAYDRRHDYNNEMIFLNKLITLCKNNPPLLISRGVLFEKMNHIDSAKEEYNKAKIGCEKILATHSANVNIINDIVLLTALTEGGDKAIDELTLQIKTHPNLSSKLSVGFTFYKNFDRHAFIYGLATEGPSPPGFK